VYIFFSKPNHILRPRNNEIKSETLSWAADRFSEHTFFIRNIIKLEQHFFSSQRCNHFWSVFFHMQYQIRLENMKSETSWFNTDQVKRLNLDGGVSETNFIKPSSSSTLFSNIRPSVVWKSFDITKKINLVSEVNGWKDWVNETLSS